MHPWLSRKEGKLCARVWFLDDSAAEVELEPEVRWVFVAVTGFSKGKYTRSGLRA